MTRARNHLSSEVVHSEALKAPKTLPDKGGYKLLPVLEGYDACAAKQIESWEYISVRCYEIVECKHNGCSFVSNLRWFLISFKILVDRRLLLVTKLELENKTGNGGFRVFRMPMNELRTLCWWLKLPLSTANRRQLSRANSSLKNVRLPSLDLGNPVLYLSPAVSQVDVGGICHVKCKCGHSSAHSRPLLNLSNS